MQGIYPGSHPISFRVFIGSFIVSFRLFWADSTRRRITLTIHALSCLVVGWILLDSVLFVLRRTTGFEFSLTVAEILSGLLAVRINPLNRHTLQLRARIGFRDQNEDVLANFDQSELLLDALHLWVSVDRRTRTTTTKYLERRNADHDRVQLYGSRRPFHRAPYAC